MSRMTTRVAPPLLALAVAAACTAPARAQQPPAAPQNQETVETDPIDCWWRTSATAVRVGEPFTVSLTCGVLETDSVKVVADQSALEPSVVQMPPFDVLGGTHGPDLHAGDRRFFQYDYRVRLIGDEMFGTDVSLPPMKVSYRVQSQMAQGSAIEGGDRAYQLPSESIRVLALVPAGATGLREAPAESFADIDARVFRANVMQVAAGILFGLAALLGILALVKAFQSRRSKTRVVRQLASDAAVLRAVDRELSAIERERAASGWSEALAARGLAALRIVGCYAWGRPVVQTPANAWADGAHTEGCLTLRAGWLRRRAVVVSGSATMERAEQALERSRVLEHGERDASLDELRPAFEGLSRARYGAGGSLDDRALDESIEIGRRVGRREARRHSWVVTRITSFRKRKATPQGTRVWVR